VDKSKERALQREAERLLKSGKMPTLDELCAAVLETRKKYATKIRRARREAKRKVAVN
jgi:hypothetical protein